MIAQLALNAELIPLKNLCYLGKSLAKDDLMIKRIYDLLFALVFLVICAPVMIFAALGVLITSRGPIIYKAKRLGKDGTPFTLYKFRSMKVNSGEVRVTTLTNDERIYPFGNFLRKSKIDELPQLVNIILGHMSVVGPRPEDLVIAKKIYVGKYKKILNVKPGLTSPASLFDYTHGEHYQDEDDYIRNFLPKKLDLELYYVEHYGFWYDVKLTAKTAVIIVQMLFGKKTFSIPNELNIITKEKDRHSNL
jgi:lipopolysaccharide/colanic/teichoic acid biosynthesis glycosyltransferase